MKLYESFIERDINSLITDESKNTSSKPLYVRNIDIDTVTLTQMTIRTYRGFCDKEIVFIISYSIAISPFVGVRPLNVPIRQTLLPIHYIKHYMKDSSLRVNSLKGTLKVIQNGFGTKVYEEYLRILNHFIHKNRKDRI